MAKRRFSFAFSSSEDSDPDSPTASNAAGTSEDPIVLTDDDSPTPDASAPMFDSPPSSPPAILLAAAAAVAPAAPAAAPAAAAPAAAAPAEAPLDPDELPAVSGTARARRYCFTLWDLSLLPRLASDVVRGLLHIRMYCYQEEISPRTGRRHAQGYIEFDAPVRFSALRTRLFPSGGCRWSTAFSQRENNVAYCSKEASRAPGAEPVFWPSREVCEQSERAGRPLAQAVALVQAGRAADVPAELPQVYVIHHRGLAALDTALNPLAHRDGSRPVLCLVVSGPPGVGKSYALQLFAQHLSVGGVFHYPGLTNGSVWMDGYQGEETMVFNEFEGQSTLPVDLFKIWVDRYRCSVSVKGMAARPLRTRLFLIATNRLPRAFYTAAQDPVDAVSRRITAVCDLFATPRGGTPLAVARSVCEWLYEMIREFDPTLVSPAWRL